MDCASQSIHRRLDERFFAQECLHPLPVVLTVDVEVVTPVGFGNRVEGRSGTAVISECFLVRAEEPASVGQRLLPFPAAFTTAFPVTTLRPGELAVNIGGTQAVKHPRELRICSRHVLQMFKRQTVGAVVVEEGAPGFLEPVLHECLVVFGLAKTPSPIVGWRLGSVKGLFDCPPLACIEVVRMQAPRDALSKQFLVSFGPSLNPVAYRSRTLRIASVVSARQPQPAKRALRILIIGLIKGLLHECARRADQR